MYPVSSVVKSSLKVLYISLYLVDAPVVDGVDVAVGLLLGARVVVGAAALPAALVPAVLQHAAQTPAAPAKDLHKRARFIFGAKQINAGSEFAQTNPVSGST